MESIGNDCISSIINLYFYCINLLTDGNTTTTTTTTATTTTIKKIENASTSNHYFKDTLFKISMISILYRQDDNQSVMNLLMTCKDAMKWKDSVVFPRLPLNDIVLGKINQQLPRRYNSVDIENEGDLHYFKKNKDGLINHHCRELKYLISKPIPAGFIPDHFTKIISRGGIQVGSIPPFTTHLILNSCLQDQKIYRKLFPDTLEKLYLPYGELDKRSDIQDLLPHNIRVLSITSNLVKPYLFKLKQLRSLTIFEIFGEQDSDEDEDYDKHIDVHRGTLPNTIEHLYLENCVIETGYILPSSIKYLSINLDKNSLDCVPSSVEYLHIYSNRQDDRTTVLEGTIPSSVTTLKLDGPLQLSHKLHIPRSVTTLTLEGLESVPPIHIIPDSITTLYIRGLNCQFDGTRYPKSIKYFGMDREYKFPLKSCIPPSTKYFDYQVSNPSKVKAKDIPNGVTHIRFGPKFDQSLVQGFIPDSCEYLEFPSNYDKVPLWRAVPKHLKTVACSPLCHNISENIPSSIKQTCSTKAPKGGPWANHPGFDFWDFNDWHLEI
ncbi:hypothetical protein DFA_04544 [Cavenderia fasciculata]|uniref:FNIP repeat-containing protein n=1 Tax=Cavenderia fasciculata TaxID=261658 RepID=F4PPW0_CACFS|nr:uncharacterized protein DFA_04544 [Cavenderia fasciculata]EGG22423.1 hypothetical protein DFA_04544 [Cavenderia fasciculata]|eukprot:XP_004360274.1 hypothetical protein DFA_04544 [Cavenderia fasciculata]